MELDIDVKKFYKVYPLDDIEEEPKKPVPKKIVDNPENPDN